VGGLATAPPVASGGQSGRVTAHAESLWPFHGDQQARGEAAGACAHITGESPSWRPPTSLVPGRGTDGRLRSAQRHYAQAVRQAALVASLPDAEA